MAKLWPSLSSTVVCARRVVRLGMVKPPICSSLCTSSAETSGATLSWIWPLSSTSGVTFSFTPNGLNWIEISWGPLGTG